MPNNAEILEKNTILAICTKILLAIETGDCKTVDDIKTYINAIIAKTEA